MLKLNAQELLKDMSGYTTSVWKMKEDLLWHCWLTPDTPACLTVVYTGCHNMTGHCLHVVTQTIEPCIINNALVIDLDFFTEISNLNDFKLMEAPE